VLDLGTGSGAIALALASERPHWQIVATDLSRAALAIAADNALRNGLDGVRFILSDWYDALADARFHLVLSNPPYIDPLDVHLGQGDLRFEPRTALAAGAAGYADLARIIQDAPEHLHPGGWVLVEHGFAQAPRVRELFRQAGFRDVRTVRDLSALERVSIGSWGSEQP
jgi:release factor glutamine methyltransferase